MIYTGFFDCGVIEAFSANCGKYIHLENRRATITPVFISTRAGGLEYYTLFFFYKKLNVIKKKRNVWLIVISIFEPAISVKFVRAHIDFLSHYSFRPSCAFMFYPISGKYICSTKKNCSGMYTSTKNIAEERNTRERELYKKYDGQWTAIFTDVVLRKSTQSGD